MSCISLLPTLMTSEVFSEPIQTSMMKLFAPSWVFVSVLNRPLVFKKTFLCYLILSFTDVTGGSDGSVRMYEFIHPDQIVQFRGAGQNDRVNKVQFNPLGNKV